MRSRFLIGNWKLNGSLAQLEAWLTAVLPRVPTHTQLGVALPAPYLALAVQASQKSPLMICAQTVSPFAKGAHTGEVSASMVADVGVRTTLIGHSERRQGGETAEVVIEQVARALEAGLKVILCVGETLEAREANQTLATITAQVGSVLEALGPTALYAIAYEPIWAIGTGISASPQEAQAVHAALREYLATFDEDMANSLPLLYGGSVNAKNIADLMAQPDIDGALIGGASLQSEDFLAILENSLPLNPNASF